jgi:ubiquinone biosynthesis protein
VFSRFDVEPLASASVAQVHAAQLKTGEEVVVKVIRPGLKPVIAQDLAWLFILARAAERSRPMPACCTRWTWSATTKNHLRRTRPAARSGQRQPAAAQLRRLAAAVRAPGVLGLVPPQGAGDGAHLRRAGHRLATLADQRTDMKMLAERGVEIFFTQVFRDSFFHADMHPGNIFVSTVNPWSPQYIAIDCGIVGSLTPKTRTTWRATCSPSSSVTTAASRNCTSIRAGCRRKPRSTSSKRRSAPCASRSSKNR